MGRKELPEHAFASRSKKPKQVLEKTGGKGHDVTGGKFGKHLEALTGFTDCTSARSLGLSLWSPHSQVSPSLAQFTPLCAKPRPH